MGYKNLFRIVVLFILFFGTGCSSGGGDQDKGGAGGWGTAIKVDASDVSAAGARVAVRSGGRAVSVWRQDSRVWARTFNGSALGAVVELGDSNPSDSGTGDHPCVVLREDGKALAVWSRGTDLYGNYFDGTGWQGALVIDDPDESGTVYNPEMALSPNGTAFVIWTQPDSGDLNVHARRFSFPGWSDEICADNTAGEVAGAASAVAVNGNGKAAVCWVQKAGGFYDICAKIYNGGVFTTDWSATVTLDTGNDSASCPRVGIDDNGRAIVVWQQSNSICYSRFDGTNWGAAALLEDEADAALTPQISMPADGRAMVVWRQQKDAHENVWARYFDGTSWGTSAAIESNNDVDFIDPVVNMNGSGKAVMVCVTDGGTNDVWGGIYDGTAWSTIELIETGTGYAHSPFAVISTDGMAAAVWCQENSGTTDDIWANYYR